MIHPPSLPSSASGLLLQRSFWLLFLTALVGNMLSKGATLLPGMAPDDYAFAFQGDAAGNLENFVSQGRVVLSLLTQSVDVTGLSLTSISFFTSLLAFSSISLAIAAAVSLTRVSERNNFVHYVAAVFAATHPYLTSYFLFRMSAITHAFVYLSLFFALLVLTTQLKTGIKFTLSVLVLVICSHANQAILILYALAAGAWAVTLMCEVKQRNGEWPQALYGIVFVLAALLLSTTVYLLTSSVLRSILGVGASETYTPHLQGGVTNTLHSGLSLAYGILLRDEPIMALWLKILLCVGLLSMFLFCLVRDWFRALSAALFLGAGLLATVSPLALSWGGHVPRTFSPAGLCFALFISMVCAGIRLPFGRLISASLIPLVLAFCAIGSTLFYQQLLVTQWDQRTATAIYARALEFDDIPRLQIAAGWPAHTRTQSMTGEGINESAFLYDWSLPGLFAVSTGEKLDIRGTKKEMCNGIAAWPSQASVSKQADGSILVCMIQ